MKFVYNYSYKEPTALACTHAIRRKATNIMYEWGAEREA